MPGVGAARVGLIADDVIVSSDTRDTTTTIVPRAVVELMSRGEMVVIYNHCDNASEAT